jgi:hypothetical protein
MPQIPSGLAWDCLLSQEHDWSNKDYLYKNVLYINACHFFESVFKTENLEHHTVTHE